MRAAIFEGSFDWSHSLVQLLGAENWWVPQSGSICESEGHIYIISWSHVWKRTHQIGMQPYGVTSFEMRSVDQKYVLFFTPALQPRDGHALFEVWQDLQSAWLRTRQKEAPFEASEERNFTLSHRLTTKIDLEGIVLAPPAFVNVSIKRLF